MLDYWGLSFKQATDELLGILDERGIQTPEGRRWVVAVCGPHPPAEVELGDDFLTTWNTKGADFALMLGEFYCAELKAPELVRIERDGVVFARIYDLRGRNSQDRCSRFRRFSDRSPARAFASKRITAKARPCKAQRCKAQRRCWPNLKPLLRCLRERFVQKRVCRPDLM